jgi:excisionase family DNA binding protein
MSTVIPIAPRQSGLAGWSDSAQLAAVMPIAERAVYTVKEVAYLLSLSLGNTYELLRNGTIPAERLGRRWVIPRARFHAWLDGLTVDAEPDFSATGSKAARPRGKGRH